jgi:hypothetical protein
LIIADIPYNLGNNAYASNPAWYKDGDNSNGESELAGKSFFDTDEDLINIIKTCDIMVKGGDYKTLPIIGKEYVTVVLFERIDEYSSTKKIQHIIDRG